MSSARSSAPVPIPQLSHSWVRSALDAVLYSSTWLALAALSLTWATFLFWQVHIPWRLGTMIFTATLFLYNLDSVLPYKHKQPVALSGRKSWMRAHRQSLFALAMVALAVAGGLFLWDGWQQLVGFIGHLAVISLLYSLPVVKVKDRWWALRDFPLLKVFLIAYVWAAVTVWIPALYLHFSLPEPVVLILFARRFLFILALAFVFDIRDYSKDRLIGTHTFPGVFGVRATKLVALAALVAAALLVPIGMPVHNQVVYLLPLLLAAGVIWWADESRSDYFFALLADGVMIVQFLVVWAANTFLH
ncbi:UbiA family prenyltransferase [Hymenobacter taeanensis]|uniref:UbiA family prenyltransferase n=1 Tax=Hymenobacter taeanensis TaxID=2735321 RepID=A0A6M6BGV5_9BACT|nr:MULTISPECIES: UbiA family prenyltransferase [Hymenobacter]QJX47088.1 UbiA family prenyltransferase [Hymenobacter taeanensis]UOQ80967.1 UbiA family prenyltransferase [Hymenobacter sp. 5414T-23]